MALNRQERRRQQKQSGAGPAGNSMTPMLEAVRRQAGMAYQRGDYAEAQKLLDELLRSVPRDPGVLGLSALVAYQRRQPVKALKYLSSQRSALDAGETDPEAYRGLAGLFSELGAHRDAEAALRRAVKRWPGHCDLLVHHCETLNKIGKAERAAEAAGAALKLDANRADAWHHLGVAEQKRGRLDDAIAAYRKSLEISPKDRVTIHNLGAALITAGRAEDALDVCEDWLSWAPADIEALAMKGHVLQELGRREEAGKLFDFDRFVKGGTVRVPDGYDSLDDFNTALERHVMAHRNLEVPDELDPRYHHPSLSIALEMLSGETGPVADLEVLMREAVDEYLATMPDDADHPFVKHKPDNYKLYAWGAVLDRQGNLDPHVHKDGFLSGCYYLRIPDEITADANGQDGDIAGGFEVGRPPKELGCHQAHITRQFKPYEGFMLLFPAYLYHCTIPFRSKHPRVVIAFDVMPA